MDEMNETARLRSAVRMCVIASHPGATGVTMKGVVHAGYDTTARRHYVHVPVEFKHNGMDLCMVVRPIGLPKTPVEHVDLVTGYGYSEIVQR